MISPRFFLKVFRLNTKKSKQKTTLFSLLFKIMPNQLYVKMNYEYLIVLNTGHCLDSASDLAREAAYKIYYWKEESQERILQQMLKVPMTL